MCNVYVTAVNVWLMYRCFNGADFDKTTDGTGKEGSKTTSCVCSDMDFKWLACDMWRW